MCGRFSLLEKLGVMLEKYEIKRELDFEWKPSYNIAPGRDVPIAYDDGQRMLALAKWGLVPSWKKENEKPNLNLINARAESINEKPIFRDAFARRRCLIPFSNFFEWQKIGSKSTPYFIGMKNHQMASFGGIFETNKELPIKFSFSIITTEPNSLMRPIHNRMPFIVNEGDYSKWLDPALPISEIKSLLKPYAPGEMVAYEISQKVNSPANDSPEVILPVRFTQKRL